MIDTVYPASRNAVASCQTRRSNGLGRFSTRMRTRFIASEPRARSAARRRRAPWRSRTPRALASRPPRDRSTHCHSSCHRPRRNATRAPAARRRWALLDRGEAERVVEHPRERVRDAQAVHVVAQPREASVEERGAQLRGGVIRARVVDAAVLERAADAAKLRDDEPAAE